MMHLRKIRLQLLKLHAAVLGVLCTSCGTSLPSPTASCDEGTAQIAVTDASLHIVCGCDESEGTVAPLGEALTCTVPTGTGVTFVFLEPQMDHQIVSSGAPELTPSPLIEPGLEIPVHVVILSDVGSYAFHDVFLPDLGGTIVVR